MAAATEFAGVGRPVLARCSLDGNPARTAPHQSLAGLVAIEARNREPDAPARVRKNPRERFGLPKQEFIMRFWLRELAGWVLVFLGLYVFLICIDVLVNRSGPRGPAPLLLESGPLTLIGIIIFRGGIHLLKVSVAARICLIAQAEIRNQESGVRGQRSEVRGQGSGTRRIRQSAL
jgi:hypothetical protein